MQMILVKKVDYQANGSDYNLLVYQVEETQKYQIYIAKDGLGVGDIFVASQEIVNDAKNKTGTDLIDTLIKAAKDDINRNEFGMY